MPARPPARRSAPRPAARRAAPARSGPARMPFERVNYVALLGSVGLVVAGYVTMAVNNATSADPTYSPVSLTVAPMLLLAGYLGVVVALLLGRRAEPPALAASEPDATP